MIAPKLRFKADDGNDFPELEAKSLFDICEYRNKQSVGKNYVGTENMKQNFSGLESLDEETEMKGVCYSKGDTLMSNIRPYLRKTWKADREGVCSTDVLVFHPLDVASEYLHYLIASDKFISYVMTGAKGVKMPRGDKEHMMKFSIMVPSLPEQQKIADFLSTIDTIIEKQQATVSAWEERKKGVMQKLFSQEVRFKADDGSDFPDWEEKRLGDICKTFSGGTPKSGEVRYYENGTISFIRSGEIHDEKTELFITEEGLNESSARMVYIGDILYALYGATSGEVDISKINGAINQAILCIRPVNNYEKKFLVEILRYKKEYILRTYLQGGQGNLSAKIIQNLHFDFPCADEQQKIADCLSALDTVIEKQKETLEKWQELKKGLLQQMFV